ncbi:hypothetical protein SISSUDRAFT_1068568 [Sistotremastrum suecicum HHB10207 ss-3]|uniref:Neuroguidin n=1 Tax=Sistotremastrum suecicum HHB10207 ss-3 TaxID=1314776 RepID=A0A166IVX5_9AGAM|nr:hypothetical protein SISSUDRAFT_1068568 [Sistotremastrum suecicum HHB10207 ss-3]
MAEDQDEIVKAIEDMTSSVAASRKVIKGMLERRTTEDFDTKDGISLLSYKNYCLMSYLHSLTLLTAHRLLGHSFKDHSPPTSSFGNPNREARGHGAGDVVDKLVENRIIIEKVKILEGRMKYQIEKLLKLATEPPKPEARKTDDPLSFRPNPANLVQDEAGDMRDDSEHDDDDDGTQAYRPPKLAPVPYTETSLAKSKKRRPDPSALASLRYLDSSNPHAESSSGLGVTKSMGSARARELQRMTEFEEENMTRLVMTKKEANRRRRDEEDIALGGVGGINPRSRNRGGGFEEALGDVLKVVGRDSNSLLGDGYEELRQRGRKESVLKRSHTRIDDATGGDSDDDGQSKKKGRFDQQVKRHKRRAGAKPR